MSIIRDGRTTYVYFLVDPRPDIEHEVFYVGISMHPTYRFSEHRSEPWSAPYDRIRQIEADGCRCGIEIIDEFYDRQHAHELEYKLIARMPGLVNRHRPVSQYWKTALLRQPAIARA
jgi:hypothetical protein